MKSQPRIERKRQIEPVEADLDALFLCEEDLVDVLTLYNLSQGHSCGIPGHLKSLVTEYNIVFG